MQPFKGFDNRKKFQKVLKQTPIQTVKKVLTYGIPVLAAVLVISVLAVSLVLPKIRNNKTETEFAKNETQTLEPMANAIEREAAVELPQVMRDQEPEVPEDILYNGAGIATTDKANVPSIRELNLPDIDELKTEATTSATVEPAEAETPTEAEVSEEPVAEPEPVPEEPVETPAPTHRFENEEYVDSWVDKYVAFPLNLRECDNFDARVLEVIPKGEKVTEYRANGEWSYILHEKYEGYVYTEYLTTEYVAPDVYEEPVSQFEETGGTMYIAASAARLRAEATTGSDEIGMVSFGEAVTLMAYGVNDIGEGWYKVTTVSGQVGYIRGDLLQNDPVPEEILTEEMPEEPAPPPAPTETTPAPTPAPTEPPAETTPEPTNPPAPPASGPAAQVAALCETFVGYPYVYGAQSPSTGFDCSGLTYYCYKQFGVTLPRTAAGQINVGIGVPYSVGDYSQLMPGDLCLFTAYGSGGRGSITHVGMYIGNNMMVHASTPKTGVIYTDLNHDWYRYRLVGVRRVFY